MLGQNLVTKQTTSEGVRVDKLYVTQVIDYEQELYLAITIDRAKYSPVIIISEQGGVDVEDAAEGQMHKFHFNVSTGITSDIEADVRTTLQLDDMEGDTMISLLKKMVKLFVEKDATLLEINPLVRTANGKFICLDAKFSFDDAAAKRQAELFNLRDRSQERAEEIEADKYGLVYIRLDGNIGNVVNGAGLAMATNDAVELFGGKSANFLDAGGQATKETMLGAFKIIISDPRVKVILVNIYGGKSEVYIVAEGEKIREYTADKRYTDDRNHSMRYDRRIDHCSCSRARSVDSPHGCPSSGNQF
jgi:succinyl-CoA synthetase beta subunit